MSSVQRAFSKLSRPVLLHFQTAKLLHNILLVLVGEKMYVQSFGGVTVFLMVSTLDSRLSDPSSSPGLEHCSWFLGKTLDFQSASLYPGV